MSKVSISGNASGTGNFTIASPNSNTDRTLTLPDVTGTILTNATTTGFPAGSVIQVVNATYSTQTSTTSTTYGDTGITASITPTSTSSKILVFANVVGITAVSSILLRLNRGSTALIEFEREASFGQYIATGATSYLDSPATTSSTTYKVQFRTSVSGNAAFISCSSGNSTITLMEIAA